MCFCIAMTQKESHPDPDTILGSSDAALILRVSQRTIARMVSDGRLTPFKTIPGGGGDGTHLFLLGDIETYRQARLDGRVE
jgi:hypothetical protein